MGEAAPGGLHGHGPDYTLANDVSGHTHINKSTKQRTSGPLSPEVKETVVKKVTKKKVFASKKKTFKKKVK